MKCPHCLRTFDWNDCITEPGAEPRDGDIGICEGCRGWWAVIEGSARTYTPTQQELERAYAELAASRQRAEEEYARRVRAIRKA